MQCCHVGLKYMVVVTAGVVVVGAVVAVVGVEV
jgi:hypothetical protein